jgi:acetyl esterase
VPVEEHVVPGQMHGFFTFPHVLPGAAQGMDLVVAALARRSA